MRAWLILLTIFTISTPVVLIASDTDATLNAGLQACEVNGIRAGHRIWYPDNPALATKLEAKIQGVIGNLGDIVGTEVVASRPLSQRVQRYWIAIYFNERPLWLRIDRYTIGVKRAFLPLEFSLEPRDILPEEITGR